MKKIIIIALAFIAACKSEAQERCENRGGSWQNYNCTMTPVVTVMIVNDTVVPVTNWVQSCSYRCVGGDEEGWH